MNNRFKIKRLCIAVCAMAAAIALVSPMLSAVDINYDPS